MKTFAITAAVAAAALATPALAQTVENGSFETPTVTSPTYGTPGTTVLTGGAGLEPNGGAFGYAAAPDGNQILHLQQGGSATLGVSDLVAGQSYFVSFLAAARPGYATLPVSVAFDGATIGTFAPTSTAFSAFTNYRFTATAATGALSFIGGAGAGDLNTGIDLVSIAGVPEPATWALMMLGFGAVGASLRRRSSARGLRFA